MFANAEHRLCCRPEDGASEPIRVAVEHRIEVANGSLLGVEQLVGDVEVLARLRDQARSVVIEVGVLMTGHDRASTKSIDAVNGLPPSVSPASEVSLRYRCAPL